jgi:glycerophosphoryl diester phosphodiesterase
MLALLPLSSPSSAAPGRADAIARRMANPDGGMVVVAHRGCHNPAPSQGITGEVAENSLAAMDRCVVLGVDVMETDIRRTRDGHLAVIHDADVDRITDGHGKVADLTLAELQKLRIRNGFGGPAQPFVEGRILTLAELMAHAAGRIVVNLDVKDASYVEVIAEVRRLGVERHVIVKNVAGIASPALAALASYRDVPFMPIVNGSDARGSDIPAIIQRQTTSDRRPVAVEASRMDVAMLDPVGREARRMRVRLMVNSLFTGFVTGIGGDAEARVSPAAVWGRYIDAGVSVIQTDEPAALLAYVRSRGAR